MIICPVHVCLYMYVYMCLYLLYQFPASLCILVCLHSGQTNTRHVLARIYLSLWGRGRRGDHIVVLTGGGFLSARVC